MTTTYEDFTASREYWEHLSDHPHDFGEDLSGPGYVYLNSLTIEAKNDAEPHPYFPDAPFTVLIDRSYYPFDTLADAEAFLWSHRDYWE